MKRLLIVVIIILLVSTAGCSTVQEILGEDANLQSNTTTTTTHSATSQASLYTGETNTDDIVLRLSDLGQAYNYTGGSTQINLNNSSLANQDSIIKQQERSFLLADQGQIGEKPLIVLSFVVIYENESRADAALQSHLNNFNQDNVSNVDIAGVKGQQAQFQTGNGMKSTAVYGRDKNMVFYVITAGTTQYHTNFSRELFVTMISDVPTRS